MASGTRILHLHTPPQKSGQLASKLVQAGTLRNQRIRPEIALLTEMEEICPEVIKQFRDVGAREAPSSGAARLLPDR